GAGVASLAAGQKRHALLADEDIVGSNHGIVREVEPDAAIEGADEASVLQNSTRAYRSAGLSAESGDLHVGNSEVHARHDFHQSPRPIISFNHLAHLLRG